MTSKNDIEYKAVKRLKKNDSKAFEYLFHTYYDQVHGFVTSTLFDKTFAEDITQSVFVTLWEQRKCIDPDKKLSSFLYTIARNKVYRQTERLILQKKHQEYVGENNISDLDIMDEVNSLFLKKIITDLIEELPTARKTIFKMSRQEEMNNKEIASELFISEKTVETQIRRSVLFLKKRIQYHL